MTARKTVRTIIKERHIKIQKELEKRAAATGRTIDEVLAVDPFLAGQAYIIGMIEIDMLLASQE